MRPRLLLILLLVFCGATLSAQLPGIDFCPAPQHEVRAVWLTTLSRLDWPSSPAVTESGAAQQRKELCDILDRLKAAGINTVLFQARVRATSTYDSPYEPWDGSLTGTPGRTPPYDPLAFVTEECHRRNMELHAWVVAFPICKVATARQLGKKALPARQPELCRRTGDQWMMDPAAPGTADYLAELCADIVRRYPVDGIHLDYIRYPEKAIAWNDRADFRKKGKGLTLTEWRRANVSRCVERISKAVKAVRPWVKMSCSPVGKYADLTQQSSYGWNARDAVAQEAQRWLEEGWMDYLFPMMYFDGQHFYPFAVNWQEESAGRCIVPGLGIYFLSEREKDWPLTVIKRQMNFLRTIGAGGTAHFRSRFFTDNVKGLYDFSSEIFYRRPALVPPMTWAKQPAPDKPQPRATLTAHGISIHWPAIVENTPVRYNIYRYAPGDSMPQLVTQATADTAVHLLPALPELRRWRYAVTAVNAYGMESERAEVCLPATAGPQPELPVAAVDTLFIDNPERETAGLIVADPTGRSVCEFPKGNALIISALQPGIYELRGKTARGVSRRILWFRKM